MRKLLAFLALLLWAPLLLTAPSFAQQAEEEVEEEKGRFLEFIENRLSTDNRIIRVSGIEGALSSEASIDLITIADREGVWLRLEGNVIDWSRSQLLRGRLEIERLAAERIEVLRTPLPDPDAVPSPEAGGFSVPDLPLSIRIEELVVGEAFFGEPLFGQEATVFLNGSLFLADGSLDSRLAIERLDGPGGSLTLALAFAAESEEFTIDLALAEPADGIVANLANIEGRPPVALNVEGAGPLDDLDVSITLDAGTERVLSGAISLMGTDLGRRIAADLDGAFAPLLPASVREFVGASSTLDLVALQREGGGLTVQQLALDSGEVQIEGSARTAADGFLELLDLTATIAANDGETVTLPGGVDIQGAEITVDYGTNGTDWNATARLSGLDAEVVTLADTTIQATGTAELDDPEARSVTFRIDGDVAGLDAADPDLAAALGSRVRLDASGAWTSGQPLRLDNTVVNAKAFRAALSGVLDGLTYEGTIDLDSASLAPFSGLAGRDLAGALALDANGSIAPVSGAFDLTLDGTANGLETGIAALDNLLGERSTLGGRVVRDETGLRADQFMVDGAEIALVADGSIASENADFQAGVVLDDLSAVSPQLSGRASIDAQATGTGGVFDLALAASVPDGSLAGRDLDDATLRFNGQLNDGDLRGDLAADATLAGEDVSLAAAIATLGNIRELTGLSFTAGEARLTGDVRQGANGLLTGEIALDAPSIATLAALGLLDAQGAANADIVLAPEGDEQTAEITASASGVVVGETRLGSAEITAAIDDLFGVPVIDGLLAAENVEAGGVTVNRLNANANGTAERTTFEAEATLNDTAEATVVGALRPVEGIGPDAEGNEQAGGFALDLSTLELSDADARVSLIEPSTVTVANGAVGLDQFTARIGEGVLTALGSAGETLDLTLDLQSVPLDVANAIRPDLALDGALTGGARVTGTAANPQATFDLAGSGLTAAQLRGADVDPLTLQAAGDLTDGTLRLERAEVTNAQGLRLNADAVVPVLEQSDAALSANLAIETLPLSIANGFREGLNAAGTLQGTASVSGSLETPEATFQVSARNATAAPLQENGIEPLALDVDGSFADNTVQLANARLDNPQGVAAEAQGTVPLTGGGLDLDIRLEELPLEIAGVAAPDLGLTGRVQGTANVTGTLREPRGAFSIEATDLSANPVADAGVAPLDATIDGELLAQGVRLAEARVTNDQGLALSAQGLVPLGTDDELDLTIDLGALPLALGNAVRPELELSGILSGRAEVSGALTAPEGTFDLQGRALDAAPLREANVASFDANISGALEGRTLRLDAAQLRNAQGVAIQASGTVPLAADAPVDLDVSLSDVPLALGNAAAPDLALGGRLSGTASVAGELTAPTGTFDVRGTRLTAAPLAQNGVQPLDVTARGELQGDRVVLDAARITNPQGIAVSAQGTAPLSAEGPLDLDVSIDEVPLSVANAAAPDLALDGTISGTASVAGTPLAPTGSFDLSGRAITAAPLAENGVSPLDLDVAGVLNGQSVDLSEARIVNAQGLSVRAQGTAPLSAQGPLDLDVAIDAVPLSIANAAAPDLGLGGTVSGTASVAGTPLAPTGTFDLSGEAITAAPLRQNGVAPLTLSASGASDGRTVRLDAARVTNGQGLAVSATGTVPITPGGEIDIDVTLDDLPLSLGNAARPDLGLAGRIGGRASVNGPLADPRVGFDLDGSGISAAPLRENGIDPLTFAADGTFANNAVDLGSARVTNGQGIAVTASGRVPLSGPLAVDLDAAVPLSLANRFLIDRGAQVGGTLLFDGSVSGPLADPQVNGTLDTANASFTDPLANLRLQGIDLNATVTNNRLAFNGASAVLASGGVIRLDGSTDLDPALGVPVDLVIALDGVRYSDNQLVAAELNGRLTVTGAALRSPLIAGTIDIVEANITVPDAVGAASDVLDIEHFQPPIPVRRTLERARVEEVTAGATPTPTTRPNTPRLDITVNAPNRIFIRGRGLDAEVGGSVTVRGPVTDVRPTGAFELIRGRLTILTQRITFEQGTVTLVGDLDPFIDFRATTQSGDVLVIIAVTGRASDLDITFSSEPELPQDEVLARLIFDRGLDELSPLQIARLAAAAAELAGAGGTSILSDLRGATGLDDLDVTTDAEGNAAVRAGRYINDNIYLGVEAGAGGGRVTVDLDITDDIKARATTGPDESTLGVFFEKDF